MRGIAAVAKRQGHRLLLRYGLHRRPLLWMAPAVVAGCAAGGYTAGLHEASGTLTRGAPLLWAPALAALPLFALALNLRRARPWLARAACALALAGLAATYTARRVLPPDGDIARLVRATPRLVPTGPVQPRLAVVRGWVSDFPRRGEFKVEFPLEVAGLYEGGGWSAQRGSVWVAAPLDAAVEVGDAVVVRAELTDLPRAGNAAERSQRLDTISHGCWCRAGVPHASAIRPGWAPPTHPFDRNIARLRSRLLAHYDTAFRTGRAYPAATAQLLAAMVFGQGGLDEPLPRLTREEFRAAGLMHVLVASGTQVTFLVLFVLALARLAGLHRWWLLAAVVPSLGVYSLLAGGAPSIWRAAIAGTCLVLGLALGRDADRTSLWSLALILVLAQDPAQLYSLSLQLTFGATWGLLVLAPPLHAILHRMVRERLLAESLAFSLAAQACITPLLLYHFGRVSTAGIGASLVGLPLSGVLVGTGMLGLVCPLFDGFNYHLTRGIAQLATAAAAFPGAQWEGLPLRLRSTALIYLVIMGAGLCAVQVPPRGGLTDAIKAEAAAWLERLRRSQHRWAALLPVAALWLTVWLGWLALWGRHDCLRVALLDVGQGESLVIRAPSGRTVVVDGGTLTPAEHGEVGRTVILPYLQSLGVERVDVMVATHADADHLNALAAVVRELPVGMLLDGATPAAADPAAAPGADAARVEYQRLKQTLLQRGIADVPARAGQRIALGDGITLTVLSPMEPLLDSANNNAVVLRLEYGATSMLLTADIEAEAEERLVHRGANLRCTILKVGHHGSKTSTSPLFLHAALPSAAIISCGRYNTFGHPSPLTLQHLAAAHIPVYRTDVNGTIEITSDGKQCWVETYR